MSSSVDSGASKRDGTLIRPATDHAQGGDAGEFLAEEALRRLEAGLRAAFPAPPSQGAPRQSPPPQQPAAARRMEGATFSRPRAQAQAQTLGKAHERTANWLIASTPMKATGANPPLAPGTAQPEVLTEEPISSPSWRRRKVALLLCALLLIIGAAAFGVLLKARTGASTDAAPVDLEASGRPASVPPDNDRPHQPITSAVKSSAAMSTLPSLSRHRPNDGSKRKGPPRRRHPRR